MKKLLLSAVAIGFGAMLAGQSAQAYPVTVQTANTNGASFNAVPGAISGGINATFTYTGPLNFLVGPPQNSSSTGDLNSVFFSAGTISGYSGSGTLGAPANADFTSLSSFLNSSGSVAGYGYGSLYSIDLGTLSAGTILTIQHDDGISLYQGGTRIGSTNAGPTEAITESVKIASTGDTVLWYARENGAPSVLNVAVPEPASLALLGMGLAGLGFVRRRKQ